MLELLNESLRVELLHPNEDHARFGVRYCTGGYIFQVHDARHGPLLTGPTYPESFNWFDGQGIPDAFNLGPVLSATTPGHALVLGTGLCDLAARKVLAFAHWDIETAPGVLVFTTGQAFEGPEVALRRTVSLDGRTIRSRTELTNKGGTFVPVRWFPHPFYPQLAAAPNTAAGQASAREADAASDELLWINTPLRWREGDAYSLRDNGWIARRGWPWQEGKYLPLEHDAHAPLVLLQRHPSLGLVAAATSYVPAHFPIWGNAHTFSWEPFLERLLAPGITLDWWIDYQF